MTVPSRDATISGWPHPSPSSLPRRMSVSVRTLFFAAYRDLLGTDSTRVDLPDGATVSDLVRTLRSRGQPFDALPDDPPVAVNRSYATPDERLEDGDEVAFLPPVAGG